jgi:alanine racemase
MQFSATNTVSNNHEYTYKSIVPVLHSSFVGTELEETIDSVSIDSRSLQNSESTLFFAIVGPNNDAHAYINDLIDIGVQNFVVRYIPDECINRANFFTS